MKASYEFQRIEVANPTIWLPDSQLPTEFRQSTPQWDGKLSSKIRQSGEYRFGGRQNG